MSGASAWSTSSSAPARARFPAPTRLSYADMAAMETLSAKMTADPKYWDLVNGAAACFIAGSMHDGIWQTL